MGNGTKTSGMHRNVGNRWHKDISNGTETSGLAQNHREWPQNHQEWHRAIGNLQKCSRNSSVPAGNCSAGSSPLFLPQDLGSGRVFQAPQTPKPGQSHPVVTCGPANHSSHPNHSFFSFRNTTGKSPTAPAFPWPPPRTLLQKVLS